MPESRVPPAVTFAFERYVAEVCHRARLDDYEWPLKARELLTHLQNRWREGDAMGLSTTAAEQRALDLFGSPKSVARGMRRPWWKRLLLHHNCRLHRHLTFLSASTFVTLLLGFQHLILKDDLLGAAQIAGSFTNAFFAVGSVFLIKWQPREWPAWLRTVLLVRHVLWFFVATGLLNVVLSPFLVLVHFVRTDYFAVVLLLMLAPISFGFLGAACLVAEILDLPGRRKAKAEELMAFRIIK